MKKYLEYLYGTDRYSLKRFLGDNIVETLIEWEPKGDQLLTRERLITMIDCVHGTSILKDRDFRTCILNNMPPKEIREIRDNCLKGQEKQENDILVLIDIISKKTWGKNHLSQYLLKLWDLPESVLEKEIDDTETIDIVTSNERFYELLDYQYYIKQRVLNNLNSGILQERMLIHMPTGTGKTKTTMHIITNYLEFTLHKQGLVIWIAHTKELLQQAYETFNSVWRHLGDGEITTYKVWGNHNIDCVDKELNGVAFCGLSKLMSIASRQKEVFERLKKDCRLVVFDEAHKASAKETQIIIEDLLKMPRGYENRALIGLSATPGRTTEHSYDNNLLSYMFGNKLININADILNQINMGSLQSLNMVAENNIIKYFQERRILSKIKVNRLTYQTEFTDREIEILKKALESQGYVDRDFSKEQIKILARNKDRNREIMIKLRNLYKENVPTIVFACSVDHARMLSAMLELEEIPNSLVLGDMDAIDRKNAIESFKSKDSKVNIIINYEVLTTGFDATNIKCVFITRPTHSIVLYSQMLGRGLRGPMMGGNEECILVDIDDNLELFDNETAFMHFNDYWRV